MLDHVGEGFLDDLTKAELSVLLGQRELPKTGIVDELVERLVEADGT